MGFFRRDEKWPTLEWWRKKAICNEESVEYWQHVAKFYRERWNEALTYVPADVREKLLGQPDQF